MSDIETAESASLVPMPSSNKASTVSRLIPRLMFRRTASIAALSPACAATQMFLLVISLSDRSLPNNWSSLCRCAALKLDASVDMELIAMCSVAAPLIAALSTRSGRSFPVNTSTPPSATKAAFCVDVGKGKKKVPSIFELVSASPGSRSKFLFVSMNTLAPLSSPTTLPSKAFSRMTLNSDAAERVPSDAVTVTSNVLSPSLSSRASQSGNDENWMTLLGLNVNKEASAPPSERES